MTVWTATWMSERLTASSTFRTRPLQQGTSIRTTVIDAGWAVRIISAILAIWGSLSSSLGQEMMTGLFLS